MSISLTGVQVMEEVQEDLVSTHTNTRKLQASILLDERLSTLDIRHLHRFRTRLGPKSAYRPMEIITHV